MRPQSPATRPRSSTESEESRHIGRKIWLPRLKALQRPQLKGDRDTPIGLGPHRLQIRQQQETEMQGERGRRIEDNPAMRNRNRLTAEGDLANPARSEERLSLDLDIFFLHHNAGRDGGKRRTQPLAVAVDFVVALAGRRLGNGIWIELAHGEVRRDAPDSKRGSCLMPGLPSDRERIPPLRALLADHLVNDMPRMRDAPRLVEGVAIIVIQYDHIRAIGDGHRRCGFIQSLGLDGKVRRLPRFNGLLGKANRGREQCEYCTRQQRVMGTERKRRHGITCLWEMRTTLIEVCRLMQAEVVF